MVNLAQKEDDSKVFYNTGGLQLKNSLSNGTAAKSSGI